MRHRTRSSRVRSEPWPWLWPCSWRRRSPRRCRPSVRSRHPRRKGRPAHAAAGKAVHAAARHLTVSPICRASGPTPPMCRSNGRNGVTKEFYTPDEAEAAIKAAAEREAEQTEPGTTADVHYDFSQFGLDRSQSKFATNLRTSLIVDPPDGKIPPLNAQGQKRAQPSARRRGRARVVSTTPCRTCRSDRAASSWAGPDPRLMNAGYNANYQIVQAPGYVMILTEMIHDVRIIPLDDRPQPPRRACGSGPASRAAAGKATRWSSRRRTSMARTPFRGASENMKVTERFTRVADDAIDYKFTVEDPTTWDRGVDGGSAAGEDRGTDLRVRLPRDQLRHRQHPGRRTCRGEEGAEQEEGLELDMRVKLAVVDCLSPPCCWRASRRLRAHHAFAAEFDVNKPLTLKGSLRQVGDGESPLLVPRRCEGAGRQGHRVDDRRRQPESIDSHGCHEEHRADRDGAHRSRATARRTGLEGGRPELRAAGRHRACSSADRRPAGDPSERSRSIPNFQHSQLPISDTKLGSWDLGVGR